MKKKIVLCLTILFVIFSINAYALNTNFEIQNYHVDMNVRNDNSYQITETIDVNFSIERHGIIRNIPLNTYMGNRAKITDVKVEGHKYSTYTESGDFKIKIGDPDKYADKKERYKISYIYHIGEDKISKMDELYFNLIGLEWDVYIRNVTFNINMPYEFDKSKLNITYGKKGSTQNSEVSYSVNGTNIKGKLNKELGPNEGLTIALPLKEGYFDKAKNLAVVGTFITNNYELIYLLTVIAAILLWGFFGKNRVIFPTVEFYAPKGLTPADTGYIYDSIVNPYDITSLIIYWADKGYIQIEEHVKNPKRRKKTTTYILNKIKDIPDSAKEYEKKMFNNLFDQYGNGESVNIAELKYKFYSTIKTVKSMIENIWKTKETRIYTRLSKFMSKFIHLFTFFTAIVVGFGVCYNFKPAMFSDIIIFALLIGLIIAVPVIKLSAVIAKWNQILPRNRKKPIIKNGFWIILVLAGTFYALPANSKLLVITGYIVCFCISLLAENCSKRTPIGDKYMERILGFREFILHAEKDRINTMVEDNPQYYFNVLPYAMVLGITDKWARKFEGIAIQPPDWYKGYDTSRAFNSVAFASAISIGVADMANTMSETRSSSGRSSDYGGSSGGGEAGGGSGGGGGDDW